MAPELRATARKAAVDAKPAKVPKTKSQAPVKKRKAIDESVVDSPPKKAKVPKTAGSKKAKPAAEHEPETAASAATTATKKKKKKTSAINGQDEESSAEQNAAPEPAPEDDAGDSSDEEVDDQTVALLTGFESEDDNEAPEGDGFTEGRAVPKLSKKLTKKANAVDASASDGPGVLYIGRIPHGFYENEMRQYFSQFGDITRLRLSRNAKTGRSKHFAFIEFKSKEVAEITAKAMDNYLLFGHILKVKPVPLEQVHPELWKGANKQFKKIPWNKLHGKKLEAGKSEQEWEQQIERETERRATKAEKLKAMGYEFESPAITSAKGVSQKPKAIEQSEVKAIEEPTPVEEVPEAKPKKAKKSKAVDTPGPVEAVEVPETKGKKKAAPTTDTEPSAATEGRKRKSKTAEAGNGESAETVSNKKGKAKKGGETTEAPAEPRAKRAKKSKA